MPDQNEQIVSSMQDLQEPSELQRFGPTTHEIQEKRTYSPEECSDIYRESVRELRKQGFSGAGENELWIGFKKGNTEFIERVWGNLASVELSAIESGEEFPPELKDAYRICVDVEPAKLPQFIEMLGEQFSSVPIYGTMVKASVLQRESFSNVLLHLRGVHKNEVLDFAVALGYAVRHQLGTTETDLDRALEVVPDSGVYITQGTYQAKVKAQEMGLTDRYSPDMSVFATEYADVTTYLARRKNQFLIEENLYLFNGAPLSEKLVNLQTVAFDGLDVRINLGIRKSDVRAGDYSAPSNESLPELLGALDSRYAELVEKLGTEITYEQALRLASFTYTASLLIHPLKDGNGQSCANLATSCLYDLGFKKIYLNPFLDRRVMRSKAFGLIGTAEAPTSNYTEPLDPKLIQQHRLKERQNYSRDLLKSILEPSEPSIWETISNYVVDGDYSATTAEMEVKLSPYREYGKSFIPRIDDIYRFMQLNLTDEPFGSKNQTFAEQNQSHEEALRL